MSLRGVFDLPGIIQPIQVAPASTLVSARLESQRLRDTKPWPKPPSRIAVMAQLAPPSPRKVSA